MINLLLNYLKWFRAAIVLHCHFRYISITALCRRIKYHTWTVLGRSIASNSFCINFPHMTMRWDQLGLLHKKVTTQNAYMFARAIIYTRISPCLPRHHWPELLLCRCDTVTVWMMRKNESWSSSATRGRGRTWAAVTSGPSRWPWLELSVNRWASVHLCVWYLNEPWFGVEVFWPQEEISFSGSLKLLVLFLVAYFRCRF